MRAILGALLLIAMPLLAAAQTAGVYETYIYNPGAALRALQQEAAELEVQVAELAERSREVEDQYRQHHDRAVTALRFYDAFSFNLVMEAVFGSDDLVDLFSRLWLLGHLAEYEAGRWLELREQHTQLLTARQELDHRRAALENRLGLLPAFQEAHQLRQELMATYPDPLLRDLALAVAWHGDAPMALELLQHIQRSLQDGSRLFQPAGTGDDGPVYVLTQEILLEQVLPLPASLSGVINTLEIFLLPDHAYWVINHQGQVTILITRFERHDRTRLKLHLVQALYRGVPLPEEQVQLANEAAPLLINVGMLGVDPATVRHDDGRIWLGQ